MGLHKDEAIVLFKRAYGESDKIIRLFTLSSGKIAAIAKGASKSQKRFANTLEPFNHIRVEYFEKQSQGMVRIENADIVETGSGIEKSLKRACTAGFFTEFADRLTRDRERNDALFRTLKEILGEAKEREFSYSHILFYELKMLHDLGYLPNLFTCVHCGNGVPDEEKLHFSNERGGVLCRACTRPLPHRTYSAGTITRLASIGGHVHRSGLTVRADEGGGREEDIHPEALRFEREAREIMEGFVSFHLSVEFKSYRLLKSLL